VRIAYTHRTKTDRSRDLLVELIVFPVYLEGLDSNDEKKWFKLLGRSLIQSTKRIWGVEPIPSPYSSKPLPNGLAGLELGESPLEVSGVLPGAKMNGSRDETFGGSYRFSNGNEVRFQFSHNRLWSICHDRLEVQPERFDEFRTNLVDQFGPPTGEYTLSGVNWTNERVVLFYFIDENESASGKRPFITLCIEDTQLKNAQVQESAPAPHYKPSPPTASFFLPSDLPTAQ
jgi:hypothetical protein